MEKILISIITSNAMITLIIGAFVTYIVKWLATNSGERWKDYEGWAIAAVKAAEKAIPDDIPNPGLRKLDYALRVFGDKYEKAIGRPVGEAEQMKIESWLSYIHAIAEESGLLDPKTDGKTDGKLEDDKEDDKEDDTADGEVVKADE